uniref:Uncharacterized protein n=1 Tax=Aegilops tauschii subsp. strangulata TaxID=200361 RepID=A0A452XRV2_AEGTS
GLQVLIFEGVICNLTCLALFHGFVSVCDKLQHCSGFHSQNFEFQESNLDRHIKSVQERSRPFTCGFSVFIQIACKGQMMRNGPSAHVHVEAGTRGCPFPSRL